MAAIVLDLAMTEGDTEVYTFGPPIAIDGTNNELTGYTGVFQIREYASDYGAPLFEASTALGNLTITTGANSAVAVEISDTDTYNIALYSTEDTLSYALAVVSPLSKTHTIYRGSVVFTRSAIRSPGGYPPSPIPPSGCAPLTLDNLCDVVTPSPDDGDVLSYDSTSGKWIAIPATGGGSGGNNIQDTYTAGEDIIAYRAIKINTGQAFHCNGNTAADGDECIGISIQSALAGDTTSVVYSGEITEPTWNWTNGPIYVGASGSLTQSTTGLAFVQQAATAIAPTKIIVDVKLSVLTA